MRLPMRTSCAAVALILLAGCGGGSDSDGPAATETPTSSAPTTPTATAPAAEERPKDDRSDAGAITFSAFMINRIASVLGGANADDVLTLATASCQGCANLAQSAKKDGTVIQQLDEPLTISDAKVVETSDDNTEYVVEQNVVFPAGKKVDNATGETVDTLDETRFTFRVLVVWKTDKWFLGDYSAKEVS